MLLLSFGAGEEEEVDEVGNERLDAVIRKWIED